MSVHDKRVTREMRRKMLEVHNDLKSIRCTVEECNDMWLSDLAKMNDIINYLQREFEFKPPQGTGGYYINYVFAEDVPDKDDEE